MDVLLGAPWTGVDRPWTSIFGDRPWTSIFWFVVLLGQPSFGSLDSRLWIVLGHPSLGIVLGHPSFGSLDSRLLLRRLPPDAHLGQPPLASPP